MSWQDDVMAEQDMANSLEYMGEAEWREIYEDERREKHGKKDKTSR